MAWIYLFIAALFEVGWPVGFKMASLAPSKTGWLIFAVLAMTLSGIFLYLAQKEIPIGTAYAIWSGIGTVVTFGVGIFFFGDNADFMRIFSALMIICGVIFLKLSS